MREGYLGRDLGGQFGMGGGFGEGESEKTEKTLDGMKYFFSGFCMCLGVANVRET